METKTYSELLNHPKWQRKRLEIMQRDNFKCKKCSDEETTLHVHHIEYRDGLKPWEYNDNEMVTLCEHCHFEIETLKKEGDKTPFKNIITFKKSDPNPKSKIRFIFILHGHTLTFKEYDNMELLYSLPFGNKLINKTLYKLFKKAFEYKEETIGHEM